MPDDAFGRFPKPGVGCSIQPGGTTSLLHVAISLSGTPPDSFRIGKDADILPTDENQVPLSLLTTVEH